MITYFQAFWLGLLQGVTELFPISSLGHSVILPKLLGWNISQGDNAFLIFLVATHFATALVLFGFFFSDWAKIVRGMLRSLKNRKISEEDTYEKLSWLIIVATIPAGVLGLLFEEKIKLLFATPIFASVFLFLNGIMLYGAELLRERRSDDARDDAHIGKLGYGGAIKVGLLQCIALLPGFSRTGATLGGGLLAGLGHEDAARFSFLLATPIIGAAALLKLPELLSKETAGALGPTLFGALISGCAAYLSVKFLLKYFETKNLTPFAIYCSLAGGIFLVIFAF